jgi:hypothetical protein
LKNNLLLVEILEQREKDLIQQWRGSSTTELRECAWQALRELDLLAGAIKDAIREYSSTGNDDT